MMYCLFRLKAPCSSKRSQYANKIGENLTLNIPIITAAMDTVTDSKMVLLLRVQVVLVLFIKNITIKEQAEEVRKVKRSENGVIIDPFF